MNVAASSRRFVSRAIGFLGGVVEPKEKVEAAPDVPVFVRNSTDLAAAYDLSDVKPRLFRDAHDAAQQGMLQPVGAINDLMVQRDAMIVGPRLQRLMGVAGKRYEIVPANDGATAKRFAKRIKEGLSTPGISVVELVSMIVEWGLRGFGATEVLFKQGKDGRRQWSSFEPIPQQRLRYDPHTGAPAFSENVFSWTAKLLPLWNDEDPKQRGRFIVVQPGKQFLDFGLRGTYPALWSPFQDRVYGRKWKRDLAERWGSPVPITWAKNTKQKTALKQAMKEFGAGGGLILDDDQKAEINWPPSGGAEYSPQRILTQDAADEYAIALVGQHQTSHINKGEGSRASAATQMQVAQSIYVADAALVGFCFRTQLFGPLLDYEEGEGASEEAPYFLPEMRDPIDLLAFAQAVDILVNKLGMEVPASYVQRVGGVAELQEGEEPLKGAPPAPALPAPGAPGQEGELVPFPKQPRGVGARGALAREMQELDDPARLAAGLAAMKPIADELGRLFDEAEQNGEGLVQLQRQLMAAKASLPAEELALWLQGVKIEATLRGWVDSREERGVS